MGNTIFISYKFINKSGVELDSMYVSQWCDPDLGFAGDDATGCDTTRSLGYVYNGEPTDANFASLGLPPPSAGFDFFQGPKIPGAATDTAIFDDAYLPGYQEFADDSIHILHQRQYYFRRPEPQPLTVRMVRRSGTTL